MRECVCVCVYLRIVKVQLSISTLSSHLTIQLAHNTCNSECLIYDTTLGSTYLITYAPIREREISRYSMTNIRLHLFSPAEYYPCFT